MNNFIIDLQTQKYCKKGAHVVLKSDFTPDGSKKDGLRSTCKECTRLKNRMSYQKNRVVLKQKRTKLKFDRDMFHELMRCRELYDNLEKKVLTQLNNYPYEDVIEFFENKNSQIFGKRIPPKMSYQEIINQIENKI